MKKVRIILLLSSIFFFNYGCNTIAGAAKGVVEDIRVMIAIENTMQFKGVYHVLGGLISPMVGIGPSELRIDE